MFVDYGFFGQTDNSAHDTLPVLLVRDRKRKGIWSHPVPSKGVGHPYPARALMADVDFMGVQANQEPSIVALCDAVMNGWHGEKKKNLKLVPRARARAMEKLSVPFNQCTDRRGPSKTSRSRNLELRWSPGVRC